MHPNATFRLDDRALVQSIADEVGFGMVFAQTPDGPRVAHAPLFLTGDGAIQFHLSRGNALTKHLAKSEALIVVNGPDSYVSPQWYSDPDQVPTWNYVAVEFEGPVRQMEEEGLVALLEALSARHEATIEAGNPWTMDKLSDRMRRGLLRGILGFELEIRAQRETLKLSQNKPDDERNRVIAGLEAQGSQAMAALMRGLST